MSVMLENGWVPVLWRQRQVYGLYSWILFGRRGVSGMQCCHGHVYFLPIRFPVHDLRARVYPLRAGPLREIRSTNRRQHNPQKKPGLPNFLHRLQNPPTRAARKVVLLRRYQPTDRGLAPRMPNLTDPAKRHSLRSQN